VYRTTEKLSLGAQYRDGGQQQDERQKRATSFDGVISRLNNLKRLELNKSFDSRDSQDHFLDTGHKWLLLRLLTRWAGFGSSRLSDGLVDLQLDVT
jgi:hypothetical protein